MASRLRYVPVSVARTVLVGDRGVQGAYNQLQSELRREGILEKVARRKFYEKPTKRREREEYEKCNRIYNKGMRRKVHFVMRQHSPLPTV